jgi:hypothetical protein
MSDIRPHGLDIDMSGDVLCSIAVTDSASQRQRSSSNGHWSDKTDDTGVDTEVSQLAPESVADEG